MSIISGNSIGKEICDALGLENVIDCDISMHLDNAVSVTVTYFPDEEHVKAALSVVKKYRLIPACEKLD